MKKTTDIIARRLALTFLAVLTTSLAWAQISSVIIDGYSVTYCGNTLVEGQDYLIDMTSESETQHKLTISGINNFGGSYTKDVESSIDVNVTTWETTSKTGWHAISSPINGQAFSAVTTLTPEASKHNIYRYDESKRQWQEYRNEANIYNSFDNGRGYVYRHEENEDNIILQFYGTCNSGPIELTLSKTDKGDVLTGFSLIGDHYAHEIRKGQGFSKIAHYNEEAPMPYIINNGENFASANINSGEDIIVNGNVYTHGILIFKFSN